MRGPWLYVTLTGLAGVFTLGCKPQGDARPSSSMLEDSEHVVTAEDKAGQSGKPLPFPREAYPFSKPGEDQPSAMLEDLEVSKRVEPEGDHKLAEPRSPIEQKH